mmetsp:Transcript_53291/g.159587  ORF Transcript_53291/g.159587 Transcript_53291/m.159587 type:complete len:235 (-) Transcript_53291:2165-2869(-)
MGTDGKKGGSLAYSETITQLVQDVLAPILALPGISPRRVPKDRLRLLPADNLQNYGMVRDAHLVEHPTSPLLDRRLAGVIPHHLDDKRRSSALAAKAHSTTRTSSMFSLAPSMIALVPPVSRIMPCTSFFPDPSSALVANVRSASHPALCTPDQERCSCMPAMTAGIAPDRAAAMQLSSSLWQRLRRVRHAEDWMGGQSIRRAIKETTTGMPPAAAMAARYPWAEWIAEEGGRP